MKFSILVAALALAGCAEIVRAPQPALPEVPASFQHADASAAASLRADWWQLFDDAQLAQLVEQALQQSTSVQAATARLRQARALSGLSDAARLPQLDLSLASTRQGGSAQTTPGTLHALRLGASYEVDLMGRLSDASRAARLDATAAAQLLAQARLLVQADVAQNYFALRALDAERALMLATVTAYQESLDLTLRRQAQGDLSELDVERLRAEVNATRARALALERQRQSLESTLAVLVGARPGAFHLDEAMWDGKLPAVPAGLPSTMLARRPDLAAARASLDAADLRIEAARHAWFPSLSLTMAGGSASSELSQLLKGGAGLWGAQALLSTPLFDGGRRTAGVQAAAGAADLAAADYRAQLLQAFKDVEDQLAALQLLQAQEAVQASAVQSAARALLLSESRYRNGMIGQLEVLDARRTELASRQQALQVKAARFQATVALIKALGGGWS
ncbi:efflux transporter outer membrane subunit [Massilia sp. TS11]|uniref:efflux transporter outer membrane subunit n=1 Tax=Massilia sp. TS11 TaxID=2908003 RepID=UPI001EDAEA5C|nr:efflux transporter outer membrane subunit [Massilia sp. TS11]MCG2585023.1 efflux transporter outer membrane subunit [Massilia sp. TS11]